MIQVIDSNGNIKNIQVVSTTIAIAVNAISANGSVISSGTIVFSNSNGISFGANGQTVTASFSGAGGGAAISGGANSQNSGTVNFSNSNGVTFGLSNNGVMTASHNGLTSQSNQAFSAQGGSSAFQTLSFNNANGATFSNNGGAIELSYTVPSTANLISRINVSAGTTSNNLTNFEFSNANGVSFGLDGSTITATVKTDYLTTAMASNRGSDFVQATASFAGTNASGTIASNGISVSVSAQSAVPQNASLYALGNTTQNSSTQLSVNALSFNAIGSITMGYSNGSIQVSVPNVLTTAMVSDAGSRFVNISAGLNLTNISATFNSNSISLSIADAAVQSNQTVGLYATGNTTQNSSTTLDARSISFNAIGSITMGYSNGSIQVSAPNALTTAMASNRGSDFVQATASFNGTNASGTIASSGISVSVANASNSSWTISDAATSATVGRLAFTNSNGLTLSLSTSNNGNHTVIGSYTVPTVTNSSWTVSDAVTSQTIGGLAFTNSNGLTLTLSTSNNGNATVIGSYTVPSTAGLISAINLSAGTTSNNLSAVTFSNSNNMTFGLSGSVVTGSFNAINLGISTGGNTAGTTGTIEGAGGQYLLVGSNGITLSQSTNGVNSGTLSILGNTFSNSNDITFGVNNGTVTASYNFNISAGSTSNNLNDVTFSNANNISFGLNNSTITASYLEPLQSYFQHAPYYAGTTAFTMGGSSNYVQPFNLPFNISASYIRIANSLAFGSTTGGTTANTSLTLNNSQTIWINIYSKGVGGNSKSLQYVTGGSVSLVFQVRAEIGAASNNQTVSHNFTFPSSEGAAQGNYATNYNVNSGSYNISTTHLTSFNGFRWLDIPFAVSLSRGAYWMAVAQSTATATTGGVAAMTNVTARNTFVAVSQINTNIALMGVSSNMSTAPWLNGLGLWSTNSIGESTSSIGLASISSSANQPILPFQLIR